MPLAHTPEMSKPFAAALLLALCAAYGIANGDAGFASLGPDAALRLSRARGAGAAAAGPPAVARLRALVGFRSSDGLFCTPAAAGAAPSGALALRMPSFSSLESAWDAYLFTNHTYFHAILDTIDADAIFKQTNRTWLIPTVRAREAPPRHRRCISFITNTQRRRAGPRLARLPARAERDDE